LSGGDVGNRTSQGSGGPIHLAELKLMILDSHPETRPLVTGL
jgi:hypothetical protein